MPPDQRREAIVAAALEVAVSKGLASTTVRDVAAVMGTSSGLIHHYFDSMDDVLAAAFEQVARQDLEVSARLMGEAERPGRGAAGLLPDLHAGRQGLGVPAVARRLGGGGAAAGAPGDVAPAQPRVAGPARADDPGRRRGRGVRVSGPGRCRVADPVAARRAGAPGRRPRDDHLARGRRPLDHGRGGGGAGAGGGVARGRLTLAGPPDGTREAIEIPWLTIPGPS